MVASAGATIAFSTSRDAATRCRLDDAAPVPCISPWALTDGPHVAPVDAGP
ncbi:MAG: hypothetical protein R2939_15655 [Kofleriaceae bacterium]